LKISRKTLTNIILLLFAAGVFVLIGVKTDWQKTWQSIRSADPWWVLGSTLFMLGAHWLRGARWTMLTEPAGYKLNQRRSFYSVMVGYLVNVATSRGGEIARCAITAKSEKAPLELLIGTVVTERLVDFAMLFLVCIAALILQFEYVFKFFNKYIFEPLMSAASALNIAIAAAVVLILVAGIWFLLRKKSTPAHKETKGLKGIILRFADGLKTVFQLRSPSRFILFSIGIWVGYWLSTWCVLKSLEVTNSLDILNALSVVIFASIGIAIPLPAGAGVWGAVSIGLQTVYGMSVASSETYGIYTLAVSNINMVVFGAICYLLIYLEMQKIAKNVA
jgi:uncharacterized protein (TIRG00374 family)